MHRYSSPAKQAQKQAAHVMKQLQGKNQHIASQGTVRNYEQALRNVAKILAEQQQSLKDLTPQSAQHYLNLRAEEVGQKALDMERQALQKMMRHVTHQLNEKETLPVIKSELDTLLTSRAYTREQVHAIIEKQAPQNALATEIAYTAGLRTHEFYTLRPIAEQPADPRPALNQKFSYREGERYSVIGKGGLIREVLIPKDLVQHLEERRLDHPRNIVDRTIHYQQHYAIGAGRNLSQSFTRASQNVLGWSEGIHGLRHSYAQERMDELRAHGIERNLALEIVSQEMGHFRPDITEIYLR